MKCPECGKEMVKRRTSGKSSRSSINNFCNTEGCPVIKVVIRYDRGGHCDRRIIDKRVTLDPIMLKERERNAGKVDA